MTAAGTGICDGCDREGPAQQLEEVILPSGAMIVCPECRYHAEELAERSTADCEGCGETVTAADLSRTELPDGAEMVLCPDCRDGVAAGDTPGDDDVSAAGSGPHGGATDSSTGGPATDSTDEPSATGSTGGSVAGSAGGSATGSTGSSATGNAGDSAAGSTGSSAASGTGDPSATGPGSTGSATNGTRDAVTDGATSRPATTQNTCDQCGGLFSIELYQVITVDGRTEEFCPDCKDDGIEEGIVRDVELRRAQAYEVLGLAGSASSDDVRQAYLEQVKEVHPDRADGSRSEFMLVQQAYERLRDD